LDCNVCGKSSDDLGICNECLSIAKIGTYVVCVKCDKIALTIFGPSLSQRTYYCIKCRACTGEDIRKKPLDIFCTKEEAENHINKKKENKDDRQAGSNAGQ